MEEPHRGESGEVVDMRDILLGMVIAAWPLTLGIVAYTIWRYVYSPWKIMRRDIAALAQQMESIKSQTIARSDEEVARIEQELRRRRVA